MSPDSCCQLLRCVSAKQDRERAPLFLQLLCGYPKHFVGTNAQTSNSISSNHVAVTRCVHLPNHLESKLQQLIKQRVLHAAAVPQLLLLYGLAYMYIVKMLCKFDKSQGSRCQHHLTCRPYMQVLHAGLASIKL